MEGYRESLDPRQRKELPDAIPASPSSDKSGIANPASAMLQDLIREKRAETQKVHKTYDTSRQHGRPHELDGRDVQSSPLASTKIRDRPAQTRRSSGFSTNTRVPSTPKEMGLREMQEHVSKINKQNFDLKLEIFHRRQRNDALEAQLEKMEGLEADNEEMQAINEDLVLELEKRDAAVKEAVNMICELEAKIEGLELAQADERQARSPSRSEHGVHQTDRLYPGRELHPSASKNQPHAKQESRHRKNNSQDQQYPDFASRPSRSTQAASKSPVRAPSFLREHKKSTATLRSLYSSGNPSFGNLARPGSVLSEEDDIDAMDDHLLNSPRLSILSESGFPSIYGSPRGDRTPSPRQANGTPNTGSKSKFQNGSSPQSLREARINNWMEERNSEQRPSTPLRQSQKSGNNEHFSSIGEMLNKEPKLVKDTPVQGTGRSEQGSGSSPGSRRGAAQKIDIERSPTKSSRNMSQGREGRKYTSSQHGSMVGGNLPPTPDTMSTATMSTATIGDKSSSQSIITEKSMLDGATAPSNGYAALLREARPQSSDSKFSYTFNNDRSGVNDDISDDGKESTRAEAEQDEFGTAVIDLGLVQASSFIGGGSKVKATRFFGADAAIRPTLQTHATDVIFQSDAFSTTQPSRSMSYQAPMSISQRASSQLSPSSKRSSGVASEKTVVMSPKQSSPRSQPPLSPQISRQSDASSTQDAGAQTDTDSKRLSSSSLRFRLPRLSSQANTAVNPNSVTSRLFRRSNSQSTNTPPQDFPPPRPAASRSTTQTQPRLPRPSTLYSQPFPSLTTLPSILPTAMLTSHCNPATRPGTSDGTSINPTPRTHHAPNTRRHSAVLDAPALQPKGTKSRPPRHPRREAPISYTAHTDQAVRAAESSISNSNQRYGDDGRESGRGDEGRVPGRWGLGRSASAKIRQGFGFGG